MIYIIYIHIREWWALNEKEQITTKVAEINNAKVDVGNITRLVSIRNEYIKGSLEMMDTAGNMEENILKRVERAERRNNEIIVMKISEIWVEGNWRPGGRPKNNWIKAIRRDMRACGADENTVRSREERDTSNWSHMCRIKVKMKKVVRYNQNI